MSESEHIAAAPPEDSGAPQSVMDEETRLRPEFVDKVLDAVEAGDDETARKLVEPLHPADVADLIELAARDEREGLVKALAGIVSPDVLAEMNDYVREGLLDEMEPQQVADIAGQLETDDAVALIEDLDRDEQQAVLQRMEPDDRAAVEEALGYPEEFAGRLMQRDLCAVPEHWKVGQVIDYLRSTEDLPTDFWEVFVVNPAHHPVGTCKLSTILRTPRGTLGQRDHGARADADPGRHGPGGRRAALPEICAGVRRGGRRRGPAGRHDHRRRHRPHHPGRSRRRRAAARPASATRATSTSRSRLTVRRRLFWLVINLGTAVIAASVVSLFQGEIGKYAVLAVLMPIVAGMGGNAGTQTLAVAVRALATNQLTDSNTLRVFGRELKIALANGLSLGVLIGRRRRAHLPQPAARRGHRRWRWSSTISPPGLAESSCPSRSTGSESIPAVSSAVFVTTITDVTGFFSFLGLAGAVGLGR